MSEKLRKPTTPTNPEIVKKRVHDYASILAGVKQEHNGKNLRERASIHLENLKTVKQVLEKFTPNTIFLLPDRVKNENGQYETITREVFIKQPTESNQTIFDSQGRIFIESISGDYKHSIGSISFAERTKLVTRTDGIIRENLEVTEQYKNQNCVK